MFTGLDFADGIAKDGDGDAAGIHGGLMSNGIDAEGEARDDDDAAFGELEGKFVGYLFAIRGVFSGADDGDGFGSFGALFLVIDYVFWQNAIVIQHFRRKRNGG